MEIINNPNLSFRAKGLYFVLANSNLDLITQRGLTKTNKDGLTSTESAVRELKQAGLLRMKKLRNGRTHYHLVPVQTHRDVDMVRIVLRLLKDNLITSKPNRDIDDKILDLISSGHSVFEFMRATYICLKVLNLGFSPSYWQDFDVGYHHINPVVRSPLSYILKIVKRSQTVTNLTVVQDLATSYHDYDKKKLNHFSLKVLKSKLFKKYYPNHVDVFVHP